jgi:hypothetical protein
MCSGWESIHRQYMLALNFFDYELVSSLLSDVLVAFTILSLHCHENFVSLINGSFEGRGECSLLHFKGTIWFSLKFSYFHFF